MEVSLPIVILVLVIIVLGTQPKLLKEIVEGIMSFSDNLLEIIVIIVFIMLTTSYLIIYKSSVVKKDGTFRGDDFNNRYIATIN
tara:strand:- start:263 stop:514 length:252 start_codon:yes stop_codon:yes gene_type:complete